MLVIFLSLKEVIVMISFANRAEPRKLDIAYFSIFADMFVNGHKQCTNTPC